MKISNSLSSPNFAPDLIDVEFVILHYTAGDMKRTMEIFGDPARKLCAHFLLDVDGTVYDLGGFLNGPVRKGAHAGESYLTMDGVAYSSFNNMSVGIEIINLNGNLFPYSEAQYASLNELLKALIARYPALSRPGRIIGHEHIAGFRGKCDPGIQFDWIRVLGGLGLPVLEEHKSRIFTDDDLKFAMQMMKDNPQHDEYFFSGLSSALEQRIKERNSRKA